MKGDLKWKEITKRVGVMFWASVLMLQHVQVPVWAEGDSSASELFNPVHHCNADKEYDYQDEETPSRMFLEDYSDYSYVYFGSYPQMEVTDSAVIKQIDKNLEDVGDTWVDGSRYRKISCYDTNSSIENFQIRYDSGTVVTPAYRYFKWERIRWKVLYMDGKKALLAADKALDCQEYNETEEDVTWESCSIRKWLNGYDGFQDKNRGKGSGDFKKESFTSKSFYDTAFEKSEQNAILQTTLVNADNAEYGTGGGNSTKDEVFLLSISDVCNTAYGFCGVDKKHTSSRWCAPTDYCYRMGGYIFERNDTAGNKSCRWNLRTPGKSLNSVSCVNYNGEIWTDGSMVNRSYNSVVVPALYLDLTSDSWSTTDDGAYGGVGEDQPSEGEIHKPGEYSVLARYESDTEKNRTIPFEWMDSYFKADNEKYNHKVAGMCMALSMLAYDSSIFESGQKNRYIRTLKEQMEFDDVTKFYRDDAGENICYSTAFKRLDFDGTITDLVVLTLRGTYRMEWLTNFEPTEAVTHDSFEKGARKAYDGLLDYIAKKQLGQDGRKLKIVVTGHSRGAACANLVAKMILDEGTAPEGVASKPFSSKDLHAYSFATPNSTRDESRSDQRYATIYSIVNPEDFVTKVMPSAWGYGRYGKTYALPNKSTDYYKNYQEYRDGIEAWLQKNTDFTKYKNYPNGLNEVSDYVNAVTKKVPDVSAYHQKGLGIEQYTLHAIYRDFLGGFMCGDELKKKIAYAAFGSLAVGAAGSIGQKTSGFFLSKQVISPYFEHAHMPETYLAAMQVTQRIDIIQPRPAMYGIVNCPVNVSIASADGTELARIEKNEITKAPEETSGIELQVLGDSKQFWLPKVEDYTIKLTGNQDGVMDFILCEMDADTGETKRTIYKDLTVKKGESYHAKKEAAEGMSVLPKNAETGENTQAEDGENEEQPVNYILSDPGGTQIGADEVLIADTPESEKATMDVQVLTEGIGEAASLYGLKYGDSAVVTAVCDENNTFYGWYDEKDVLLSREQEYCFVPKETTTLKAKFSNVVVEPVSIVAEDTLQLKPGERFYLAAQILPENATSKRVNYTSADETIVSVSEVGILTAKAEGETQIEMRSAWNDAVVKRCRVRVTNGSKVTQKPQPSTNPSVKEVSLTKGILSSAKSIQKKTITVKWKAVTGAKGYQVQYALNKKMTKGKKQKTTGKLTLKLKKLKKGKKYYVRVRAYALDQNGSKVFGQWSRVKSVKVRL